MNRHNLPNPPTIRAAEWTPGRRVPLALRAALVATAVAVALTAAGPAEAQSTGRSKQANSQVLRVLMNGSDGNATYFGVKCVNGTNGDVRTEHGKERICAVRRGGKTECKTLWPLQQAAEYVCRGSGR